MAAEFEIVDVWLCRFPSAAVAVAPASFSSPYLSAVVAAYRLSPFAPFNSVLLVWNQEIENPVSVVKPGRALHYLGRFPCDPDAGSVA